MRQIKQLVIVFIGWASVIEAYKGMAEDNYTKALIASLIFILMVVLIYILD